MLAGSPQRYPQGQREWDREEENYRDRPPRIWSEPGSQGNAPYPYFSSVSALAALASPAAKDLARIIEASQHGQYAPDQSAPPSRVSPSLFACSCKQNFAHSHRYDLLLHELLSGSTPTECTIFDNCLNLYIESLDTWCLCGLYRTLGELWLK